MTNSTHPQANPDAKVKRKAANMMRLPMNPETLHVLACVLFSRSSEAEKEIWKGKMVLNRIAAIVGKTYAERGDAYKLADDTALMRIRDVLLHYNPFIINHTKEYRLKILQRGLERIRREYSNRYPKGLLPR